MPIAVSFESIARAGRRTVGRELEPGETHKTAHGPLAGRLPASRRHKPLRIALALDRDCGRRPPHLREIVGSQLDDRPAEILFEPVQLGGAWDRHDPRSLRQQPGERDLSGRRFLLLGDPFGRSTNAWFACIAPGVKRGNIERKSLFSILVSLFMAPVRKPLPSGL